MSSLNSHIEPALFRSRLLSWYKNNKRDLPWRYAQGEKTDPYKIWLSEIMLQQTTVTAVIPYFLKFIEKWPTIDTLSKVSESDIIDAWAGLGYYSRARNLHKCAHQIMRDYQGIFPQSEKELISLCGIGPYTAAAILSIAYNKPANIVDGNVERVMARLFSVKRPLRDTKKELKEKASLFIGGYEEEHSDYAQSIMELGALVCTPKSPQCEDCPVQDMCMSYAHNRQGEIPVPPPKKVKPKRYGYVYLITNQNNEYLMERRAENGLLANTIGFPTSEWKENMSDIDHLFFYQQDEFFPFPEKIKHVFTHFELELEVYRKKTKDNFRSNHYYWAKGKEIKRKLPSIFKKVYNLGTKTEKIVEMT